MGKPSFGASAVVALLFLAGCAGTSGLPKRPRAVATPYHPPTTMLLPYAAPDGSLTRAQMEAGLRRDFAKYDTHHDGCLDANQARIINESRWQEDGSTASPLIDFKSNGCVDFDEFAATARSLFDMLDPKGTGKLDAKLLKPGIAKPPDAPPKAAAPDDQHRPPPSGN